MTKSKTPVNETGDTIRVLVVDDSIGARILVRTILTAAGHACTEATNGAEAFDLMLRESFDVMITDLEMPQMDGFELIRAMGYLTPGTPRPAIIVCSGRLDDPRILARPELQQAVAMLQKPATPQDLIAAVHDALNPPAVLLRGAARS